MAKQLYDLFDLRQDQELPHVIDQTIRSGVKIVGTNLWVLIFAILIASVGLNVNSTAAIIGAMLISPLMGPIVGIGYGVGINDLDLIKLALRNLAVFTFISILSSTLYFTLSPLNAVTTELLARTSPNLWDVLIAFFGGAAGIIALTRKSISNVIPGVAIATALMPPLCTAGYGISQGHWEYFGGAIFLYCINSVFIAFATLLFVKLFKLQQHQNIDKHTTQKTNILVGLTVFLMIIPSAYLAYNLVQQSTFNSNVAEVILSASKDPDFIILGEEVDGIKREITLTIGGKNPPNDLSETLKSQLKLKGVIDTNVIIRRSSTNQIDMSSLKTELQQDLYKNLQEQVDTLALENKALTAKIINTKQDQASNEHLFAELRTQYPYLTSITVNKGQQFLSKNDRTDDMAQQKIDNEDFQSTIESKEIRLITIISTQKMNAETKVRIKNWLAVRYNDQQVMVYFTHELDTQ